MVYEYKEHRPRIFTELGVKVLVKIIRKIDSMVETSGAFVEHKLYGTAADSWLASTCLDYLVEIEEIERVSDDKTFLQNRVFVKKE